MRVGGREIFIFKVRDAYAQSPISPTMFEYYDPAIHKTVIVYSFISDNDFELLSPTDLWQMASMNATFIWTPDQLPQPSDEPDHPGATSMQTPSYLFFSLGTANGAN